MRPRRVSALLLTLDLARSKGVDGRDEPAIHGRMTGRAMTKGGWVYFMSNRRNGTLYVGVTANLAARVGQHRTGTGGEFTRRYGLTRLVYYERFEDISDAIQRETSIKRWPRAWKVRLIHAMNSEWEDLYETLNA